MLDAGWLFNRISHGFFKEIDGREVVTRIVLHFKHNKLFVPHILSHQRPLTTFRVMDSFGLDLDSRMGA